MGGKKKKMLKITIIIFCAILIIISISVLALYINHNSKLNNENTVYSPPGELFEIKDHQFHVYSKGQGDHTLVFLSGHGTSYPTLDFKPLWMQFVDDYRIIVIEKSGYGWSDVSNSPRDIDTMLEETRSALSLAGETGPYILFPHSMSGLEAIYWAQQYPDEVDAIIGLDPLIPDTVELLPKISNSQLNMTFFISRIGLNRLIPESELSNTLPLINSQILTDDEQDEYIAMFYRSSLTKNMLEEIRHLNENAKTINLLDIPTSTPMYFFISSDQNESVSGWKDALVNYIENITLGESMELSTGHYVHHETSETIAEEVKIFIESIPQN